MYEKFNFPVFNKIDYLASKFSIPNVHNIEAKITAKSEKMTQELLESSNLAARSFKPEAEKIQSLREIKKLLEERTNKEKVPNRRNCHENRQSDNLKELVVLIAERCIGEVTEENIPSIAKKIRDITGDRFHYDTIKKWLSDGLYKVSENS